MEQLKKEQIPTYSLNEFSANKDEVFYIETTSNVANLPLHLPYRTAYYGFGVALNGSGIFTVNLETYKVEKGAVLTIPPEAIKQWKERTEDLKTVTIFFNKAFFTSHHLNHHMLDDFPFFKLDAQHICNFSLSQIEGLSKTLFAVKDKLDSAHIYKNQIVANLLAVAFYEYAAIYQNSLVQDSKNKTRAKQIIAEFKYLTNQHFTKQRNVTFYAEKLAITPKHLTETVKKETGKSAGEWIDEMVLLEAKVLLQDEKLNIAQVADLLNFTDPSTFGKFFKNLAGVSPLAFKNPF